MSTQEKFIYAKEVKKRLWHAKDGLLGKEEVWPWSSKYRCTSLQDQVLALPASDIDSVILLYNWIICAAFDISRRCPEHGVLCRSMTLRTIVDDSF